MSGGKTLNTVTRELSNYGFKTLRLYGGKASASYKDYGDLAHVYWPSLLVRSGYSRVAGSIGIFITNPELNGGISIEEGLSSNISARFSVTTENFKELFEAGILDDGKDFDVKLFAESLIARMKEIFPETLHQLQELLYDESSYVFKVKKNSPQLADGSYGNRILDLPPAE